MKNDDFMLAIALAVGLFGGVMIIAGFYSLYEILKFLWDTIWLASHISR